LCSGKGKMMCKTSLLLGLVAGIVTLGVVANAATAGFIMDTITVELPKGPGHGHHGPPAWAKCPDWVFAMQAEKGHLGMQEKFKGHDPFPVVVSGETDADPVMHITKDVENSSGVAWSGYTVSLEGTGAEFVGAATSSHFGAGVVTPSLITYTAPDPVAPGEILTLGFDINVDISGLFSFTMTQTPLPEPATLAFFGLGSLGLVAMRRRRGR